MASPPSPPLPVLLCHIFEGGRRNFASSFDSSMQNANKLLVAFARNVQTLKTGHADLQSARPSSSIPSSSSSPSMAEPSAHARAESEGAPGGGPDFSASASASANVNANVNANASALMLKTWGRGRIGASRQWKPASASSISLSSSGGISEPASAREEEEEEEEEGEVMASPHFDLSTVSATSVFDIGSVGSPLLAGPEIATGKSSDSVDDDAAAAAVVEMAYGRENATPPLNAPRAPPAPAPSPSPSPLVDIDDVRKFVGNAIIACRKVRALGLRESSWENKMPWRQPRPRYLAKGLQRPPEEFSSETQKHEYYRRARRRGRYLIGPTPTWSFIVADLALLYFLIDNPAGKFLL
ncbi:hypothetical protein MPTK1_6g14340 [Marchantia polymorpha subsp. ruderalis]|nr:hypothetical protein MARPO_0047s0088 [Marchantia polymorpha]BBN14767.1 hypothetical protein Mp_6g14340 [Marchantia polymorpha subsp. ruderalis]|eukprot:PTQ39110.1 hypothetical protein MARPO_0047s0088 [Marchantia polymorpha]